METTNVMPLGTSMVEVTAKLTRCRYTAEYKFGILRGDIYIIDNSRNKLYKWQKQVVRTGAGAFPKSGRRSRSGDEFARLKRELKQEERKQRRGSANCLGSALTVVVNR